MKPTTDEVLKWARSVGMEITDDPFVNFNVWELKRVCTFAYAAGAAAMKERAAKVCDGWGEAVGVHLSATIRALGDDDD